MSNIKTAKSAIQAEINHAKQGLTYYQSRIEILEQTLQQIDDVGEPSDATEGKAGKSKKHVTAPVPSSRGRRAGRLKANGATDEHELPSTGSDYWIGFITDQPQSAADIFKAAVGAMEFTPTKPQIDKLRQRLTFNLKSLLQAKKIQDSGSGRGRRYVKV